MIIVGIDRDGVCRVFSTRVTLETLVGFWKQGMTPEEIADALPSLTPEMVSDALSLYQREKDWLDKYLAKREKKEQKSLKSIRPWGEEDRQRLLSRTPCEPR